MANKNTNYFTGTLATILILIVAFPNIAICIVAIFLIILISAFLFNNNNKNKNNHNNNNNVEPHKISKIIPKNSSYTNDFIYYLGINFDFDDGIDAIDKEDYPSAIKYFTLAMKNHGLIPLDDIFVMRGIAYSKNGDDASALKDFNEAIKLFSFDNPTAFLERGKIFLRQEKYDLALKDFNQAISTDYDFNNNADYYFYRGLLYIKTNKINDAIQDLNKAISLAPAENSETINSCKFLLGKLQEIPPKENNNPIKKNTTSTVKLKTCSKKQLLTLEGFDEEKADKFLEKRLKGQMWYDIDSFAQEFNIQPHEIIMIQNRLKFPLKPKTKLGKRKLDI